MTDKEYKKLDEAENIDIREDEKYLYFRVEKDIRLRKTKSGNNLLVGGTGSPTNHNEFGINFSIWVKNPEEK